MEVLLIKATVCYSCVANGSWKLLKDQAVKLHVTREACHCIFLTHLQGKKKKKIEPLPYRDWCF